MISTIKQAIRANLKKTSPLHAIQEGLVSFDFQIKDYKQSLMQMSFSPLASWLSVVLMMIALLSPWRFQFTLVRFLGFEHPLVLFLFQSSLQAQSLVFIAFVILGSLIRYEFIATFLLTFLLSNGDIHIVLAQAGLLGILFSQIRLQLKWLGKTHGRIKFVINWIVALQFCTFIVFLGLSWVILQQTRLSGLFDSSVKSYRVEYLIFIYVHYQAFMFAVLSIWGHFYSRIKPEPSVWSIKYSSVILLPLFNLSTSFQILFENKIRDLAQNKKQNNDQLESDPHVLKILPQRLVEMQKQENDNIDLALKMIE
jgi:hypothetical protein